MRETLHVRMRGGLCGVLFAIVLIGCAADKSAKALQEGWGQLQRGQTEQALTSANSVLAENPSSPRAAEAWYLKGRVYEAIGSSSRNGQSRNLQEANAAYQEALKHNPVRGLSANIYSGLANTNYWMDDYSSAWRNWTTAYDLAADGDTRSFTLYRIGLCQQRLGRFAEADKTFAAVQEEYPGTDAAKRAKAKIGARSFAVQVATFASPQSAENAMNTVRREGFVPNRQPNAQGQSVVSIAPFANYQQAKVAKEKLATIFPDALVVP